MADKSEVEIPEGFVPLHVAPQGGLIRLWAEVETNSPEKTHRFQIIGTGHEVPKGAQYLGTVLDPPFVWHLYQLR